MRRIVPLIVAVISLAPTFGCGGLGWYRSIGHLPGVAATDYAYYDFCGTSSQLFQYPAPQVESALIVAMGDLGYKVLEPPTHHPDGEALVHAKAPDGRPADITVTPQNSLTNVRVKIGPVHIGDEQLSRELFRRVALNFGTVIRAFTPIDATLPRRINLTSGLPPRVQSPIPPALEGEGLRPGESRDKALSEEEMPSGLENTPSTLLPGSVQPFIPTRDFPNPPNMPYSPFPYTPFNDIPPN
jgi:hypothetical protein